MDTAHRAAAAARARALDPLRPSGGVAAPQPQAPVGLPAHSADLEEALAEGAARSVGSGGSVAEAFPGRDGPERDTDLASHPNRAELPTGRPVAGAGEPLPAHVSAALAPVVGAPVPGVRIHTGPEADRATRMLGASAVTVGRDILFASGRYSPESIPGQALLAHELTHVRRQAANGRVAVQASPEELLRMTVTPDYVATMTTADVVSGITLLVGQLDSVPAEDPRRLAALDNLLLLAMEAEDRYLPAAETAHDGLRRHGGGLADPADVADLDAAAEVLATMLEHEFPVPGEPARNRLAFFRARIPFTPVATVAALQQRLKTNIVAVDELAAIRKITPDKPPEATLDLADPLAFTYAAAASQRAKELIAALDKAVAAVWTNSLPKLHSQAVEARARYFDAFTASFAYSVRATATRLPDPDSVPQREFFSDNVMVGDNIWYGYRDVWARFVRAVTEVRAGFNGLGDISALYAKPVAERAEFLLKNGDSALALMRRAHALQLAYAGVGYGAALRARVLHEYQMNWDDADLVGAFAKIAEVSLEQAELKTGPTDVALERIKVRLDQRIREATARFEQLDDMNSKLMWLANIVAIVSGAALMEWSVLALGRAIPWLAGEAMAPAAVRFVVGSLVFTTGSTVVRGGLTGQWPTGGQFATQAGLDLLTFGLVRGSQMLVGLRYAPNLTYLGMRAGVAGAPAALVKGVTYSVLIAWAATLAVVEAPEGMDAGTFVSTLLKGGARSALDLVVLHFAGQVGKTPELPKDVTFDAEMRREWEQARAAGRSVGQQIAEWMRTKERDPAAIDKLIKQGQDVVMRLRRLMGRMGTASGGLTEAERNQLDAEAARQLRALENMRQGAVLGIEQVGDATYRYRGTADQVRSYLERLKRDKVVDEVTPAGADGVVTVRFADGTIAWFYPQGGPRGTVIDQAGNIVAEAVERAAPDVPAAERTRALVNLRSLPPGEAGQLAAQFDPGTGAAMVAWLAKPDAVVAIRAADPVMTGPHLRQLLDDAALAKRLLGVRPTALQAWWQTRPRPDMTLADFAAHLGEIEAYRGSLEVSDPAAAQAAVTRFMAASEVRPLVPAAPSTGMSFTAPPQAGTPTRTATTVVEQIRANLAAKGFAGKAMLELRSSYDGKTWVVSLEPGAPARAWRFTEGPPLTSTEVALADDLAAVRAAVADAEALGAMDRVRAAERLSAVADIVERLEPLRRSRGPELREIRDLLDRAQPDRFTRPAPLAIGPTTLPESLGRRRDDILARAARMGLPRSEAEAPSQSVRLAVRAVEAMRGRNPRGASRPETLSTIAAEANVADSALDRVASDALDRATDRLGADAVRRARRGRLAKLTDAQVGEVLEALRGRQGVSEGELRGFLHAAFPPGQVAPIPAERILERVPSAAERRHALDVFARLVDAGIPGTHEVLRSMLGSSTSWRGGMFALDILSYYVQTDLVLGLEVRESAPDPLRPRDMVRVYDIVLRSETAVVELKDWRHWFEETLRSIGPDRRSQFEREVLLKTNNLADPLALRKLHWIFKGPGPAIEGTSNPLQVYEHIRGVMRGALNNLADEFSLPFDRRAELLEAFDAHRRIVEILNVDRTNAAQPVRRLAPDPEQVVEPRP